LSDYVTVYHRDVCNDGFGLENVADAVFLDLPSPWKALPSAKAALKKEGGRICSFSPCIEQVQKTVNEMTQLGFTDMYTIEILRRVLCVKKYSMPNFDFNMDMKVTNETTNQSENVNSDENKRKEACNHNENKNSNKKHKKSTDSDEDDDNSDNVSNESIFTAKAINLQPGHTGFLTFATLLHKDFLQTN
jgi:tRNA (adenine57-N1/adenine58-N1)-methyltransferase